MWSATDLIVAPATVGGPGARAVVRIAGDGLAELLAALVAAPPGGFARHGDAARSVETTLSPETLGEGWSAVPVGLLHWPGPAGPTGGPLAEVQLPAAGPLVDAVVAAACRHGARLARGGEFSLRSFLAGRLDLLQAEAVLAVVDARTPSELAAALDALAGGVGRTVDDIRDRLLDLTADIEAAIDFADERTPDAVPVADAAAWAGLERRLGAVAVDLDAVATALSGRDATAAADLPRVVLAGPPNIGKSSLFNALLGRSAALVADEAGTTRDWVAGRLDSGPGEPACLLVDLAGVVDDPAAGDVADADLTVAEADAAFPRPVDRESAARARAEIARADVVVVCRDAATADVAPPPAGPPPRLVAVTRCDLIAGGVPPSNGPVFVTSSRSGAGIESLRSAVLAAVAGLPGGWSPAALRMRVGVAAAREAVGAAWSVAVAGGEARDEAVVSARLHEAIAALDEATGAVIGADLLDRIFSRHCIGK